MVAFKGVSGSGEEQQSLASPVLSLLRVRVACGRREGTFWEPLPWRKRRPEPVGTVGGGQSTKTSSDDACSSERSEVEQLSYLLGRLREESRTCDRTQHVLGGSQNMKATSVPLKPSWPLSHAATVAPTPTNPWV